MMYSQYYQRQLAGIAASYITRPLLLWRLCNLLKGYRESRSCTHSTRDCDNYWQVIITHCSIWQSLTWSEDENCFHAKPFDKYPIYNLQSKSLLLAANSDQAITMSTWQKTSAMKMGTDMVSGVDTGQQPNHTYHHLGAQEMASLFSHYPANIL